jgi:hypothetical protein
MTMQPRQSNAVELSEDDLRAAVFALEIVRLKHMIPPSLEADARALERRLAAEWRRRRGVE